MKKVLSVLYMCALVFYTGCIAISAAAGVLYWYDTRRAVKPEQLIIRCAVGQKLESQMKQINSGQALYAVRCVRPEEQQKAY